MNSNRGYVVTEDLLPSLTADLNRLGIEYRIVPEPTGLGETPRPVYVSDQPKPKGWTRYGKCPKCNGPRGLDDYGRVSATPCVRCQESHYSTIRAEKLWECLEKGMSAKTLELSWLDDPHISTVAEVREALAIGELHGVGPERTPLVSQALADWRKKVLSLLNQ